MVYGIEKTRGEIIFRTDADSIIDEDALTPMMRHFRDPTVGSVSGWIFPIQDKGLWIRVQNVLDANYMYTKRAQDVLDSIITQPGASTAFRRDALIKVGGWKDNIFGEDGEITNRISRYGYRGEFEPSATVYSEHPSTLTGLLQAAIKMGRSILPFKRNEFEASQRATKSKITYFSLEPSIAWWRACKKSNMAISSGFCHFWSSQPFIYSERDLRIVDLAFKVNCNSSFYCSHSTCTIWIPV